MLGTGNAAVTQCYNTCFALRHPNKTLLVDAGGGNGILIQLEKAGIPLTNIHAMFITHAHTDHILGAVWVVRVVAQLMQAGKYEGTFHVYGHDKAIQVLDWICRMTLPAKIVARLGNGIELHIVDNGMCFEAGGFTLQCFDRKPHITTSRLPLRSRDSIHYKVHHQDIPVFFHREVLY